MEATNEIGKNPAGAQSSAKGANLSVGLAAAGRSAHIQWEAIRGNDDDECDTERSIRAEAFDMGIEISAKWWDGWLERSDEWRDEIMEAANGGIQGSARSDDPAGM